jgi:hypothetical protein
MVTAKVCTGPAITGLAVTGIAGGTGRKGTIWAAKPAGNRRVSACKSGGSRRANPSMYWGRTAIPSMPQSGTRSGTSCRTTESSARCRCVMGGGAAACHWPLLRTGGKGDPGDNQRYCGKTLHADILRLFANSGLTNKPGKSDERFCCKRPLISPTEPVNVVVPINSRSSDRCRCSDPQS